MEILTAYLIVGILIVSIAMMTGIYLFAKSENKAGFWVMGFGIFMSAFLIWSYNFLKTGSVATGSYDSDM